MWPLLLSLWEDHPNERITMGLFTSTERDREELDALKAHQSSRREHEATKTRVTAAAEALANAEAEHNTAKVARNESYQTLQSTLKNA